MLGCGQALTSRWQERKQPVWLTLAFINHCLLPGPRSKGVMVHT